MQKEVHLWGGEGESMKKLVLLLTFLFLSTSLYSQSPSKATIVTKSSSFFLGGAADIFVSTTTFGLNWQLKEIDIHFSTTSVTNTVDLYKDSGLGPDYDVLLQSDSLVSATYYIFISADNSKFLFIDDDELSIRVRTKGNFATAYYTIYAEQLRP